MRAKFVTVEGIDGAGKSTHLETIAGLLDARGVPVVVTREPGGTPLGEKLRALLLEGAERPHPETEALLMFAARREHLERVIRPALAADKWVVCDRFTDATFAYQAGGSGVGADRIEALEAWVQQGLQPDLTLLFDVEPETGRQRRGQIKAPDRFERERGAFYDRVRAAYLQRAHRHPTRIRIIDANRSLDEIKKEVEKVILSFCNN